VIKIEIVKSLQSSFRRLVKNDTIDQMQNLALLCGPPDVFVEGCAL
jgi:hypothetical protein